MSWCGSPAECYLPNGCIDRTAECRKYLERYSSEYSVIKMRMVGSQCYAAVRLLSSAFEYPDKIAAVTMETATDSKNGMFYYNYWPEWYGPAADKCPESILKLLDPLHDEWSDHWREKCHRNNEVNRNER